MNDNGYNPVSFTNGVRFQYTHLPMSLRHAILAGELIKALNDISWLYAREVWREAFQWTFNRAGHRQLARALTPVHQCQVLEWRAK